MKKQYIKTFQERTFSELDLAISLFLENYMTENEKCIKISLTYIEGYYHAILLIEND